MPARQHRAKRKFHHALLAEDSLADLRFHPGEGVDGGFGFGDDVRALVGHGVAGSLMRGSGAVCMRRAGTMFVYCRLSPALC